MSLQQPSTIRDLILKSGEKFCSADFIKAGDQPPLTYSKFKDHYEYVETTLRASGIGTDSRVAVKIPNGPELASCLICVMGSAVCVPIHSDVPERELERIVAPLRLDAVILTPEEAEAEETFWASHGVKVITLCTCTDGAAGQFTLGADVKCSDLQSSSVMASDIALVLLTSGTTALSKHVMHTQASLVHTAIESSRFFNHTQDDCGLAVMPLNHGQGLFVGLLPVMVSGSSVVCGIGFDPGHFFDLYDTFKPTWFTAIPTFYQALLKYVSNHSIALNNHRLRYIRTGSAPMASNLMQEVEALFGMPLLMGYGSAESCHITNNPVPPGINKPGTVGVTYGNEVTIIDSAGNLLDPHEVGEVVVRGQQVTSGYLDNPEANADLFSNGWLRTGDLGMFDGDGYLTLVGRIKDQINRGGESISPSEIEESIRTHPFVVNAAVFPIEHPSLGEDIAAGVVVKHKELDERKLTDYLSEILSANKIPREFLFVEDLPLTSIGKVDKRNLANMLAASRNFRRQQQQEVNPRTDLEGIVEQIWAEVLDVPSLSVTDRFFDLGGESLAAMAIINRISAKIGIRLDTSSLLSSPTIEEQAQQIQSLLGELPGREEEGSVKNGT